MAGKKKDFNYALIAKPGDCGRLHNGHKLGPTN